MKKILLSTTAALALSTSGAFAQGIAEQVITQLQAQGYQSIEVTNGRNQVKVEAVRDGRKLEAIYDAATGAVLKQEVEDLTNDDDYQPGVSIKDDDEDFLDDEGDDDEDDDERDDDEDDDDEDDDEDEDDEDDEDDDDEDDDDEDDDDEDDDDEDDDDEDDDDDDE
jgi:hypothetical protein